MKHWFNRNYRTLIITAFLIPIITVAVVSISHVTKWYGVSNPMSWATYLSIGIEIAALSALAAISANMGKKVYFPFFVVTLIQFIGNIYFAYSYIDIASKSFKDWVDLVSPLLQFMGVDSNDYVGHRRFLSFFAGGMLPIISLSFLHMLVKFTEEDRLKDQKHDDIEEEFKHYKEEHSGNTTNKESYTIDSKDLMGEIAKVRLTDDDIERLEKILLQSSKEKPEQKEEKEVSPAIPALSDEEVREMFMDEWEKRYDLVEDDDNDLMNEELNNLIIDNSTTDVAEENVVEPTQEEIEENNKLFNELQQEDTTNTIQEDLVAEPIVNEEVVDVKNDEPIVDDEKKNQ